MNVRSDFEQIWAIFNYQDLIKFTSDKYDTKIIAVQANGGVVNFIFNSSNGDLIGLVR